MIEQTKQLVESKYTIANGYQGDAKVRNCARYPIFFCSLLVVNTFNV